MPKRPISVFNSILKEVPGGIILTPSDTLSDTNPHVKAHPEMFEDVAVTFRGVHGTDVEEATARPGEKRNR